MRLTTGRRWGAGDWGGLGLGYGDGEAQGSGAESGRVTEEKSSLRGLVEVFR